VTEQSEEVVGLLEDVAKLSVTEIGYLKDVVASRNKSAVSPLPPIKKAPVAEKATVEEAGDTKGEETE